MEHSRPCTHAQGRQTIPMQLLLQTIHSEGQLEKAPEDSRHAKPRPKEKI